VGTNRSASPEMAQIRAVHLVPNEGGHRATDVEKVTK
jgi:hypothetical protein